MKSADELLLEKVEKLNIQFDCFPMKIGDVVSLPAEYDGYLSDEEQQRLVELLKRKY